jgi:type IV secretory pathway TrbD component
MRRTPLHFSLLWPLTMGGIDRSIAILIGTSTVALVDATGSWWPILVGIGLFWVFTQIFKKDPFIIGIYRKYSHLKDKYYC